MTKTLSQLLGAREPEFRMGLRQLEQASGGAGEDIKLTAEVLRAQRSALRDLGLDPHDTTGHELYAALMQRVKEDNETFEALLAAPAGSNAMPAVARLVRSLDIPMKAFSLKPSAAKRLLRANPPKRALKALGCRSIDSVLKQEHCALVFAAASIVETAGWHKAMQAAYKKLGPSDFEVHDVQLITPDSARWQRVSRDFVAKHRQNILSFRELGAVVLLPMPQPEPGVLQKSVPAAPYASALLTLQAVNDIRAASTYLKLHLVQPDFGRIVADISRSEPLTAAEISGAYLPWKLVHQYFARHPEAYNADLFEPHVHPEDLHWHDVAEALAGLHPRFAFWQRSAYSSLMAGGEVVSLNLTDAVLNFCNLLPFEQRLVRYARGHLSHELMLRYMRQQGIERTVHDQLGSALAGME